MGNAGGRLGDDGLDLLRSVPAFAHLNEKQLRKLTRKFEVQTLPAGSIVQRQGRKSQQLSILLRGCAIAQTSEGGRDRVLGELTAPDHFGLLGDKAASSASCTVVTSEPSVLLVLTRSKYDRLDRLSKQWVSRPGRQQPLKPVLERRLQKYLSHLPLFVGLDSGKLEQLARVVTFRTASVGDVICREGDDCKAFHVLTRGAARASVSEGGEADDEDVHAREAGGGVRGGGDAGDALDDAADDIKLVDFGPGSYFGEMSLLQPIVCTASVKALEPCVLLTLPGDAFRRDFLPGLPAVRSILQQLLKRRVTANLADKLPFLDVLPPSKQAAIGFASHVRALGSGETLVESGDAADEFYMVVHGQLDVFRDGTRISSLTAGDYCGEIALMSGGVRTSTVRAVQPCVLLCLPADDFHHLLQGETAVWAEFHMRLLGAKASLLHVICHPKGNEAFLHHLQREFSQENLAFFEAVRNFHQLPDSTAESDVVAVAGQIGRDFFGKSAPLEINLPHDILSDVQSKLEEGAVSRDLFDVAQHEVFHLMERDNFTRFRKTDSFRELIAGIRPYSDGIVLAADGIDVRLLNAWEERRMDGRRDSRVT
eukprot:PLAT7663.2.p1 GENE.PLAT7663.2~~PLAT7663.2.p1  ORF type:complete len:596 (+),score=279.09 PLAT7663.2:31-1818(+)